MRLAAECEISDQIPALKTSLDFPPLAEDKKEQAKAQPSGGNPFAKTTGASDFVPLTAVANAPSFTPSATPFNAVTAPVFTPTCFTPAPFMPQPQAQMVPRVQYKDNRCSIPGFSRRVDKVTKQKIPLGPKPYPPTEGNYTFETNFIPDQEGKWKTQVCKLWVDTARCRYDDCVYAHD